MKVVGRVERVTDAKEQGLPGCAAQRQALLLGHVSQAEGLRSDTMTSQGPRQGDSYILWTSLLGSPGATVTWKWPPASPSVLSHNPFTPYSNLKEAKEEGPILTHPIRTLRSRKMQFLGTGQAYGFLIYERDRSIEGLRNRQH